MHLLSDVEASSWCYDIGLRKSGHTRPNGLDFGKPVTGFRISLPDEATAAIGLAYSMAITGTPEYREQQFAGGLVWFQRWEIWSKSIDDVGYIFLEGIRRRSREVPPLRNAPAHLFEAGEFVESQACLSIPMIMQWDAYFIPIRGDFILFVSHEGFAEFITRDVSVLDILTQRFAAWSPTLEPFK